MEIFPYTLSDQEKKEFVHLLNQLSLVMKLIKNQALSSGAVTYYKLYFPKGKRRRYTLSWTLFSVLMKSIMSLLILMNCGMSLSLSIVNKIPLSKTNGIVLLLAQKPLRQITM